MFRRVLGLGIGALLLVACGPRVSSGGSPGGTKQPTSSAEAFGDMGGVQCSAVRPQTEPDLMAWDGGSRMNLNTLRRQGVVAVRYQAEGCNVELELLPNCLGKGEYRYEPYSSNDTKVVANAQELYAELPLGAARLAGKLKGNRALRTDYQLVGMATLPPTMVINATSLEGPGCAKATHVISRIYLGGFAMASGQKEALEASATLFGAVLGGSNEGSASREASEGNPEHCQKAQSSGEEQKLCSVPLRIRLAPIEGAGSGACPSGSKWNGTTCVNTEVVTEVNCPTGTSFVAGKGCVAAVTRTCASGMQFVEGQGCVATVSKNCGKGLHFEEGNGCVPNVVAAPQVTPAPQAVPAKPTATATASYASGGAMVRIPGGSFMMGSADGAADEKPVHRVTVAAFEMDRTEVTVAAYEACVSAGTCTVAKPGDSCNAGVSSKHNHPINCVDWNQSTAYCSWVGKRLPTEEEWEYAARGTDGRIYPWGNQAPGGQLCWNRGESKACTCPVGAFSAGASPFGLQDMAGNVWEWTSSGYSKDYSTGRVSDRFVIRGGSWGRDSPSNVRAATRLRLGPSDRRTRLGFRCAR